VINGGELTPRARRQPDAALERLPDDVTLDLGSVRALGRLNARANEPT
jgi:hypothetical protein